MVFGVPAIKVIGESYAIQRNQLTYIRSDGGGGSYERLFAELRARAGTVDHPKRLGFINSCKPRDGNAEHYIKTNSQGANSP